MCFINSDKSQYLSNLMLKCNTSIVAYLKRNKYHIEENGKLENLKYSIIKFKSCILTKISGFRHSSIISYITLSFSFMYNT